MKDFKQYLSQVRESKTNESGELVPVQAGEVIKLQKPSDDTFINVLTNNDGVQIADCTVCAATGVVVGEHICKTVLEPDAQVPNEVNMVENAGVTTPESFIDMIRNQDEDDFKVQLLSRSGIGSDMYAEVEEYPTDKELNDAIDFFHDEILDFLTKNQEQFQALQSYVSGYQPLDMGTNERFAALRNRYGINESKMITKIEWFRSLNNSPDKSMGDPSSSSGSSNGMNITPESVAEEVERLFGRYTTDNYKQEMLDMFPNIDTPDDYSDVANQMLDTLYDNEGIDDTSWNAMKPGLLAKFLTWAEHISATTEGRSQSDTMESIVTESLSTGNFVVLPDGNLEINLDGIDADTLADMKMYQGYDEQFLWQFFESALTNGYNLVPDHKKGLTEAPMISTEFFDDDMTQEEIDAASTWAYTDYMVKDMKEELLEKGRVVFTKV